MQIKDELLDIEGIKNSNKLLIDLFIRRTAVLTSTPEYLVEMAVKQQWKDANKTMSEATSVGEVDFPNLGSFRISKKKSLAFIDKKEKLMVLASQNIEDPKSQKIVEDRNKVYERIIQDVKRKTKTNEN